MSKKAEMRDQITRLACEVHHLREENALLMACITALTEGLVADAERARKEWLA